MKYTSIVPEKFDRLHILPTARCGVEKDRPDQQVGKPPHEAG
jgi:hypothetical protein